MTKLLLLLISCTFILSTNAQEKKLSFAKNQIIVKFKNDLKTNAKTCISKTKFFIPKVDNLAYSPSNIKLIGNKNIEKTFTLSFTDKVDINKVIETYKNTGLFEYVEPNYIGRSHGVLSPNSTPNDPLSYPWQWSLHNDGTFNTVNGTTANGPSTAGADIDMDLAWDIEQGSSDIVVAVLDSGAFFTQQEFSGRIWENTGDNDGDGNDSDSNNYIDDINGWNFSADSNVMTDATGHGSNVAGVIGANTNNEFGYAGVDWNCKLMILKVLDDNGSGTYARWSSAIHYAVDNGANVINMSVGGDNPAQVLEDAIDYAYTNNVAIIASAGNDNTNAVSYPAAYDKVIAVGATNSQDKRANPFSWGGGSNYGPEINIVAPGNIIYGLNHTGATNWYWSGTSQAAPHATGVASLLLAQNPNITPLQIKWILESTAEDQVGLAAEDTAGFDIYYGHGRLNAKLALEAGATASISDFNTNGLFSIYPNPTKNGLLHIDNLSNKHNSKLKIYNAFGALVYSKKLNEINSIIDISSLSDGIYLVNMKNNDRSSFTQKIIKK